MSGILLWLSLELSTYGIIYAVCGILGGYNATD